MRQPAAHSDDHTGPERRTKTRAVTVCFAGRIGISIRPGSDARPTRRPDREH